MPNASFEAPYQQGVVIIKLDESDDRSAATRQTNEQNISLEDIKGLPIVRNTTSVFSASTTQTSRINPQARVESKFLQGIYKLELEDGQSVKEAIDLLKRYRNVIYVEPLFLERPFAVPNDPNIGLQDHLSVIRAFDAWDVTQGDPNMTIGISDTGVQLDNSDLEDNIRINENDPVNGIDDDENGYIDDYIGWDFADNDNDPTADFNGHGTHVAGVSSATTNNNEGISGVGYLTKMVPLKIFQSSNGLSNNSYESVIYAADQGYDVINLSWGSVGSFSQFNQDVINYAVLERNVVVVAAAGNTNEELNFYPASYDNVISVGASDVSDNKASFATYSYHIDLMAPGASVYSTRNGNSFSAQPGSSFAAPQVAGAAALVKTVFPTYNASQIGEQLRVTADDIYSIGNNDQYEGQLGSGRLNIFRAVTEANRKSVRVEAFDYQDEFGRFVFFDDTVALSLNFKNFLASLESGVVRLSSSSPYVNFLDGEIDLGALNSLDTTPTLLQEIYIAEETPPNERIIIRLDYEDGEYSDVEYTEIRTNPDYLDIASSALAMTVASDGNVGYADDSLRNGIGLEYEGDRIAEHLGLMITDETGVISDNVLKSYDGFGQNLDFKTDRNIKLYGNSVADVYAQSRFTDVVEGESSLGLLIEQEYLAWQDEESKDFVVVEYRITNNTEQTKQGVRVGFFTDWNLGLINNNRVIWDSDLNIGYAYDTETNELFSGIALLSDQQTNFYSIDIGSFNGNTEDVPTSFTDDLKLSILQGQKLTAGDLGDGNDIASVLTAQIEELPGYASAKVAFVLVSGSSVKDLESSVARSRMNYQEFLDKPPIQQDEIVCINEPFMLHIEDGTSFELFSDPTGNDLLFTGNDFSMAPLGTDSIFYLRNTDEQYSSDIYSLNVRVSDAGPNFEMSLDTLIIGDVEGNKVQFTDASADAVGWSWDFGNGLISTLQNPTVSFFSPDTYTITLTIESSMGCTATMSRQLVVAERSAPPIIEEQTVCHGSTVNISASNSSSLNLYIFEDDTEPVVGGESFTVGPITTDTVFYISSTLGFYESNLVPAIVKIDPVASGFTFSPDTTDLASNQLISFVNQSENAATYEWLVDGNSISTNEHATYEFGSENEILAELRVESALGCSSERSEVIRFEPSPAPNLDDISFCKFSPVTIRPTTGDVFYFYSDGTLRDLLFKGREMIVNNLNMDTVFYVTRADGFRESDLTIVNLDLIPFEVDIIADPDTLYLENGRNVSFRSSNEEITSWRWSIEGRGSVETFSAPTFSFDTVGIYNVQLIAENALTCKDTTYLNYVVMEPITGITRDLLEIVMLFPNPADNQITLTFEGQLPFEHLTVMDVMGREQLRVDLSSSEGTYHIDVSSLSPGLYVISGTEGGGRQYTTRLLINP